MKFSPSSLEARRRVMTLVALAVVIGAAPGAVAVPLDVPVDELGVTRWSEPPGLALPQINALVLAPDGFLWAGTRDGLARFDGRAFRERDVPGARPGDPVWIHDLAIDRAGVPWAAVMGRRGLLVHRERWEHVAGSETIGEGRALLCDPAGVLWAASEHGLFAIEGQRARKLADAAALGGAGLALARGAPGTLWVGSAGGVSSWDGARLAPLPGGPREAVRALAWTATGELWIGAASGLMRLTPDGAVVRIASEQGLPAARIYAIHQDRDGTLWVGNRLGLYRRDGTRFHEVAAAAGASGPVWDLADDAQGDLWAATSGGLLRVRAPLFRRVPLGTGGRADAVTAFHLDGEGGLWAGVAGRGLGHRRGDRWQWWTTAQGLCNASITALWRSRGGDLWIGAEAGAGSTLCRFDGRRFQHVGQEDAFRTEAVRALFEDRAGDVWIGGEQLYRAVGSRVALEPLPGATPALIERIRELPDGSMWVASRNGLWQRRDGRWRAQRPPGAGYSWFYDVTSDGEGGVIVGGESGFARIAAGRLSPFTRRNGFTNFEVFAVHRQGGLLWLATRNGPVSVREEQVRAFERRAAHVIPYRRYGRADGLPSDLVMSAATSVMSEDGRGHLWFATAGGLAVLDPRKLREPARAPVAVIEGVLVNGAPIALEPSVRRPRHQGALQIEYTAPALADPDSLRFRYRLEPFDGDWVDAGARRTALYTNLPPGRYRFSVAAALASTAFAPVGATLALELAPRLHQTLGFRAALAVVVLSIVLALHRLRTTRVRSEHRTRLTERTRIARELHDTLAQSVNAIAFRLEEARMSETELLGEARQLVDSAWSLSLQTVDDARQAIWQLRSDAVDDGADLHGALTSLAAATGPGIPVGVQVAGRPAPVPRAVAQALLRIGQEAITNAARYARATRIQVTLNYGPPLELRITDDGTGIAQPDAVTPGHFGIIGMRERADGIGAALRIDSGTGRGTAVIVTVPGEIRA